jgi:hypothetical protein
MWCEEYRLEPVGGIKQQILLQHKGWGSQTIKQDSNSELFNGHGPEEAGQSLVRDVTRPEMRLD